MGKIFSRRGKSKEEINSDIEKINNITNNELFYKKTNHLLKFEMKENFINKFIGNFVIKCEIVKYFMKSYD
jgi:hypothetical protein